MVTIVGENDFVIFQERPETSWGEISPRINRVATLDGGVVITNHGVSHGDRTFKIVADIDQGQADQIESMIENSIQLTLICEKGVFSGMISGFQADKGLITYWVNQKLN